MCRYANAFNKNSVRTLTSGQYKLISFRILLVGTNSTGLLILSITRMLSKLVAVFIVNSLWSEKFAEISDSLRIFPAIQALSSLSFSTVMFCEKFNKDCEVPAERLRSPTTGFDSVKLFLLLALVVDVLETACSLLDTTPGSCMTKSKQDEVLSSLSEDRTCCIQQTIHFNQIWSLVTLLYWLML